MIIAVMVLVMVAVEVVVSSLFFILGTVLWLSDLLAPVWLLYIFNRCRQKNCRLWLSWVVASTFVLVQAWIVGSLVGFNVGMYFVLIPSILFASVLTPGLLEIMFDSFMAKLLIVYLFPLLWFVALPAFIFYVYKKRNNNNATLCL